jgi:cytochrome bd-I ubiquinol oxidase subunit X
MWYFSWILGLGLALTFGVLNAIWYEIMEEPKESGGAEPSSRKEE